MHYQVSNQSNLPPVVKNLLIINVLLFVGKMALATRGINLDNYLALHYPASPNFEIWQLFTHFFMHADITHIFFNMFAVWMFGRILENVWGSKRFLNFYIITALAAAGLTLLVNYFQLQNMLSLASPEEIELINTTGAEIMKQGKNYTDSFLGNLNGLYNGAMLGASGALFGLLGAMFILFPNMELMLLFPPIPIKIKYFVIIYGGFELFSGIANNPGDNIAHFAHLGGLIAGIIIVKYWNKSNRSTFY